MRILLINPYWNCMPTLNLGLAYLLSSAEKKYPVRFLDMTFYFKNHPGSLLEELKEHKPDVVGISVNSFSLLSGLQIAGWVKEFNPKIKVILGGVHPTLLPEETISKPDVDAICIGEGEESFLEYLDRLQEGKDPAVPGIWYKTGGQIVRNPLRPFKEDLDELPFPNWGYWDLEKYLKIHTLVRGSLPHLASRGCPYHCTFCSAPAIAKSIPGRYYRLRSPQKIIEEIKINRHRYKRRGFKIVIFRDDLFGADKQHLKEFCNLYIKEGLNRDLPWACETRANIIGKDWAKTVADAGCGWICLGIESGDDYIRNQVYKKDISYQQIIDAVRYLRENNVFFNFSIMLGSPEDTRQTIKNSMKLVKELNSYKVGYSLYQPLPKTELATRATGGVIGKDINLPRYSHKSRINTTGLTKKDLNRIMWNIRINGMWSFFKNGFKKKGVVFILDIIRYTFDINNCRAVPLLNCYTFIYLKEYTLYRYILEELQKSKRATVC